MDSKQLDDLQQLKGILAQFDKTTINAAIACMDGGGNTPEYIIGGSILEAAKILKTPKLLPVLAATASTGITLNCGSSVTLYAKQGGTATEYDLPGGANAAAVQATAIANANADALQNVRDDLARQAGLIHCPGGCAKVNGVPAIATVTAATITSSNTGGTVWDSYTATGDAEGTLTVTC